MLDLPATTATSAASAPTGGIVRTRTARDRQGVVIVSPAAGGASPATSASPATGCNTATVAAVATGPVRTMPAQRC